MTTRCRVHGEPGRILQNPEMTTADSRPIIETALAAQLAEARPVDKLCRDSLDLLPEQAVNEHVYDEPKQSVSTKKETCLKTR